jgi:Polyketide cyclase / dehydrase and lipid transport
VRTARAAIDVPGPIAAVEALWYDLRRWPNFIDGFGAVARREGEWPEKGARLVWDSRPRGRGRVVEEVLAYEPRTGQSVEVEDKQLLGTQRVRFAAFGETVRVELALAYRLKRADVWVPLTDLLFIRRALRDSLRRTLHRFARERVGDRELAADGAAGS